MTLRVVSSCILPKHSYWRVPYLVLTITYINLLIAMINLLQRTEIKRAESRTLYQQAEIDRLSAPLDNFPFTPTREYNCFFCRYAKTFRNFDELEECFLKHQCDASSFPYIEMGRTTTNEEGDDWVNPDGTILRYQRTGLFRQVAFEGQPHHVQLFLCFNGQANCNASCYFHAWRLKNKKTWIKCGNAKLCQNDGSMWLLMAPTNQELFEEFIAQL